MPNRALVVDANILVRAVLGRRVRDVIAANAENVLFFVPEEVLRRGRRTRVRTGGQTGRRSRALLRSRSELVELIGCEVYKPFEVEARERLATRDPGDWPILACALALGCPIWTEDTDFFGCGVATWTTDRVQMFLRE